MEAPSYSSSSTKTSVHQRGTRQLSRSDPFLLRTLLSSLVLVVSHHKRLEVLNQYEVSNHKINKELKKNANFNHNMKKSYEICEYFFRFNLEPNA
jgi:hypothetical protein